MRLVQVSLSTIGLVAGCSCGEPVLVPDAESDAPPSADAFVLDAGEPDAPRDVGMDAWEPDAWIPDRLILREYDTTPCPPVTPQPHRPRALPADSTPRVLWSRTQAEAGITGTIYGPGAIDRAGHLRLSSLGFSHELHEVDASGLPLGSGYPGGRSKEGPYGPLLVLSDGRLEPEQPAPGSLPSQR